MSAILGALTAINELISLGFKVYDLYREAKLKGWVQDGRELANKIQGAKTDEERQKLAEDLFNHRAQ